MNYQPVVQAIEQSVSARLDTYIEELCSWCLIDSGTYNKQGVDRQAAVFAERLQAINMHIERFPQYEHGDDVLGIIRGTGKGTVALLGHLDTVYPVGTAHARPLRNEDCIIYGPGVCDMKGGILLAIYAIEALCRIGVDSFHEIRFLCVSDEEVGQRHSTDLIQEVCKGCQEVFVLEAARANGDIVSSRKGTAWYRLHMRGREAHAGVEAERGRNAILELAYQIVQFQQLHNWRPGLSINPGVIAGGTTQNVVPAHAYVGLDLRFQATKDRIETEKRWHELLQHQYVAGVESTLHVEGFCDPVVCIPSSMKIVQQAQKIAATLGFELNHVMSGGSSDARYPAQLGIAVLDGLGPVGGCDHSPDEYILADSIAQRAALLAGLLITLDARMEGVDHSTSL